MKTKITNKKNNYIRATKSDKITNFESYVKNFSKYELLKNVSKLNIEGEFKTVAEFIRYLKKLDLKILINTDSNDCLFYLEKRSYYITTDNNNEYIYISFGSRKGFRIIFSIIDILMIMYDISYTKLIFKLSHFPNVYIEELRFWKDERNKIFNNIEFLNDECSLVVHNEMFYKYFRKYIQFLKVFQMIALDNLFHQSKKGDFIFFSSIRYIRKCLIRKDLRYSKSQISRMINAMTIVGIIEKVDYKDIDARLTKASRINVEKYKKYNNISFYSIKKLDTTNMKSINMKIQKLLDNNITMSKISKKNIRKAFSSYTANKVFSNQNAIGKHVFKDYKLPF